MKILYSILFALITATLLSYCSATKRISSSNLSFIYKPNLNVLHPLYQVFHNTDSTSQLHFKFFTDELLYNRKEDGKKYQAKIKLRYKLLHSVDIPKILDSATTIICDSVSYGKNNEIIGFIDIKAKQGETYMLEIEAIDIYRNQEKMPQFIDIDKTDKFGHQNFLLCTADGQYPLFRNYLKKNETCYFYYRNNIINNFFCRYYNREFPLPGPPFSIVESKPFSYKADSIFVIASNEQRGIQINFHSPGLYFIQTDTMNNNRRGFSLFLFDDHFPLVQSTEQMTDALRYITTKREYDNIKAENTKKAFDRFWLNNGVTEERARELIKEYYTRVQNANRYFTSYVEGWKTDRGMIYIVFGPPNVLYKSGDSESWIYGEENNFMSLNYTFIKAANPFSDNDFQMSRSPIYKNGWYRAVDSWRKGRAFSSN